MGAESCIISQYFDLIGINVVVLTDDDVVVPPEASCLCVSVSAESGRAGALVVAHQVCAFRSGAAGIGSTLINVQTLKQ